jgi:CheY-like chemotaxis protein
MNNGQRSAPERRADDDTRLPAPSSDSAAAPRVLVAEDNQVNQLLTMRLLEQLGYHADIAVNGLAAVEAVARHTYAAVLMDCQMPGLDGFDATRRIREYEGHLRSEPPATSTTRVPIIAMTANGTRDRCLLVGMDDFIAKPVEIETLRTVLARCIGGRAQGPR